ncbi:MAG: acyltransferase, partial [Chloroflexota bacterium]
AAIAAVIAIHVIAWAGAEGDEAESWRRTLDALARVGVPAFVLLSGVLFGRSDAPPSRSRGIHRLLRLGAPWLVWSAVFNGLWLSTVLVQGGPLPTVWEIFSANLEGPGYLYFLLLLLQLSALFMALPLHSVSKVRVAAASVAVQGICVAARFAMPDLPEPAQGLLLDHAYEQAPYWVGYFGLGMLAGAHLERTTRFTPIRAGVAIFVAVASGEMLLTSIAEGWNAGRLTGANLFLHPAYVPLTVACCLTVYWLATAGVRMVPRLGRTAAQWAHLGFGVYLVHQYVLALVGPVLQRLTVASPYSVSAPLPASLPALGLLYLLTVAATLPLVRLLLRFRFGRIALGEGRAPIRALAAAAGSRPNRGG